MSTSEVPAVGAEQKSNDVFGKVQQLYNEQFKSASREPQSLESLKVSCRAMRKECILFASCHVRIVRSNLTGISSSDMVRMETGVYNGVWNIGSEPSNRYGCRV